MLNKILQHDKDLFLLINDSGIEFLDFFWVFISNTFSSIPLFLWIIFLCVKKFGNSFWIGILLICIVVALADFISVHFFKNVFMRLRPCHEPELTDQIRLLVSKGGAYGFVSSHAANFFALAAISSKLFSERSRFIYIIYSWAFLVALSRIFVGKHYPLDVVCGAILGIIFAKYIWGIILKTKVKNLFI
jgi:undecaprenyl-diphosphatase